MRIYSVVFFLFLGQATALLAQSGPDQEEWIELFDGETLEGWIPKISGYDTGVNFGDTFRVEDGKLIAAYDAYDEFDSRFGHIFYEEPFSYYRFRAEYRFVGEQVAGGPDWAIRNSGVMIHSPHPQTMPAEQDFPISIEVQLLGGGDSGERPTGNLCTPGTHVVMEGELVTDHCVQSTSPTYRGSQWVTVEIEALGAEQIRHFINGEEVLSYEKPQFGGGAVNHFDPSVKRDGQLLEGGYLSLQSESHPVEFRNVEILNLEGCRDPRANNYKSYYVKSKNSECKY